MQSLYIRAGYDEWEAEHGSILGEANSGDDIIFVDIFDLSKNQDGTDLRMQAVALRGDAFIDVVIPLRFVGDYEAESAVLEELGYDFESLNAENEDAAWQAVFEALYS